MGKRTQKNTIRSKWVLMLLVMIVLAGLVGCKATTKLTPIPTGQSEQTTPELQPSATAETEPQKILTICMAEEPQSLYIYDGRQNGVKWNVLASIYDGPIDRENSKLVPVILENIPTVDNGGINLEPLIVTPGQQVIDANGEIHAFREGIIVETINMPSATM